MQIELPIKDECYRCGYDLRGIADEQACPECGLLAQRSRRVTDELHDTRPRWLASISWGVNLILGAILAVAIGPLVISFLGAIIRDWMMYQNGTNVISRIYNAVRQYLPTLFFGPAALFLFFGVVLLTVPEGYAPADLADRKLRRGLRIAATVPALTLLLPVLLDFAVRLVVAGRSLVSDPIVQAVALSTIALTLATLPLLLFSRLRSLARRARSVYMPDDCRIVGIGTSVMILCVPAYVLIWGQRHISSDAELMVLATFIAFGLVFFVWTLGLLVNFALAFRKAARLARTKWKRDDRSAVQK